MIDLHFGLREFERRAGEIGGAVDQVPFALAEALTTAAFKARDGLINETWPKHVEVRNRNFLRAALRVEKATKRDLRVAIVDTLGRGHLKEHAEGGTKQARGRLAIPTKRVRRTGRGVLASQRPANLKRAVVKGNLIFQAEGSGKNSRLRLMFALRPSARIKPDVPFRADFNRWMAAEVRQAFPGAMAKAMRTRL